MRKNHLQLQQLLAGYFNQDWADEYNKADDVIFSFIAESSSETFTKVQQELKTLLFTGKTEQELRIFLLNEMGCGYYYPCEWETGKAWLEHIAILLNQNHDYEF